MINEKEQKKRFLTLINQALTEMKENQVVLLKRGDLFEEEHRNLYKAMYEEIKEVKHFIKEGGVVNKGYRHLQMNIFMKHESFFMNLFETQKFPYLFELFEFE